MSTDPSPVDVFLNLFKHELNEVRFLYEDKTWYPIKALNDQGRERIVEFVCQLIRETSLHFMNNIVLEIKYKPKDEPDSSSDEDDKKKEEEKKKAEEGKQEEEKKTETATTTQEDQKMQTD